MSAGEFTVPDSVTRPSAVSTPIESGDSWESAASFALIAPVVRVSSVSSPILHAAGPLQLFGDRLQVEVGDGAVDLLHRALQSTLSVDARPVVDVLHEPDRD